MERSSDHNDLAIALAEVRPAPRETFARELDDRAAAGFPRRSRHAGAPLARLATWIRGLPPQRLLFASGATGLAAIAIATVVIASGASDSQRAQIALDRPIAAEANRVERPAHRQSGGVRYTESISQGAGTESLANLSRNRKIERSAEIGLLADPTDVADDSAKVFAAVHDANGIVLYSTTSSGSNGGARFELLIPSARLGDALAAFSSVDEVRSRHEATDDITKPTVTTSEELQDTQARVDSLLAQLAGAEVESEREAIAAELRSERRHGARLRNQLARLEQRTSYSRVLVRIQSGASTESNGAWGINDAFGDAGRILGIAAGVTLVGLALIAPLALLFVLAWLAQRLWLRSRRERALDA